VRRGYELSARGGRGGAWVTLRDKTDAAYQRGALMEKHRRLMAEWAALRARATMAGEVVPLGGALDAGSSLGVPSRQTPLILVSIRLAWLVGPRWMPRRVLSWG
jgi:hypothetical protein